MSKIELLAPAGSLESLYAAVQAGADAVYLGGSKFSARAYASNFDEEGMKNAVEYCHLYGVKIYVTVNTLMKEKEIKEALKYVKFLYSVGVDALIIQDLGLAKAIKEALPDFELHASTQMTIHNGEGAKLLKSLGFKRIVLSRELSVKEIAYISKELGIETEIFIHGALCVSYSGQCLMSSLIGGRSGNRGRCAQPCRLPYTLVDETNSKERRGYLLSPKDICTVDEIKAIVESGTSSLKIEGRMKRPEYVAGVVSAYRKAIDSILHKDKKDFDVNKERKNLLQLFNREGFSKAYFFGNVGKDMMAYTFPKNTGILLGKVEKDLSIVLQEELCVKNGVRNKDKGFTVLKIFKDGKEVEEASIGTRVKLKPAEFKAGDVLYKTGDTKLSQAMEQIYKSPFNKKIYLEVQAEFKIGETIKLSCSYKDKFYFAEGEIVQKALKKPIDMEKLKSQLCKSGDTPFKVEDVDFQVFEEGFLPVSSINEVRRALIEQIEKDTLIVDRYEDEHIEYSLESKGELPKHILCVNKIEQLRAAEDGGFENLVLDIFDRKSDITEEYIRKNKENEVWLKVPNVIKEEFQIICSKIESLIPFIKGIVTANLGIVERFTSKTTIIGDYKLNIFNKEAVNFYNKLMDGTCISVELNKQEIAEIFRTHEKNCYMMIYGKAENMISEYCVVGSTFGEKDSKKACNRACEKGQFYLKDRMGEEFTVHTDKFCRCHIYNNVPLNLLDSIDELEKIGVKNFRLDFIDEGYEEALRVLKALKEGSWKGDFNGYTRGHYRRGVE